MIDGSSVYMVLALFFALGHQIMLLDDFRGDVMRPHEWLNFVDNRAQQVPIKGTYHTIS